MLRIPRVVIAGVASGVGKTTVTAGLIGALRQRGWVVQSFKCGPDYIDPGYHARASRRPCRNLDAWMLSSTQLLNSFWRACVDADIAVIEGVMGVFDGSNWRDEDASTAQLAKLLEAPVVLVTDISGVARSAAVPVVGCQHFDTDLALRGVILNFAGSEGHGKGCAEAVTGATGLPVLGWLQREAGLHIPERHLGLVTAGEQQPSESTVEPLAAAIERRIDIDGLLKIAKSAPALPDRSDWGARRPDLVTRRPILAVARDEAFCFYYPENLELLVEAGAAIRFFSPIRGECPPADTAGVYLGGGYPELYGEQLASNQSLWQALRRLHQIDAPIFAECGGFMVLTQELVDREGRHWPMAGLIPGTTRMTDRIAALGYRYLTANRSNILSESGRELRGHEFRYSQWCLEAPLQDTQMAWSVRSVHGAAPSDSMGYSKGNLLASYVHVHFGQHPEMTARFVAQLVAG